MLRELNVMRTFQHNFAALSQYLKFIANMYYPSSPIGSAAV